jgi:hypothetical protein
MQYPPSPPSGQFGPPKTPQDMNKTGALAWYGRQRRATKAGIVSFVAVMLVFGSLGLMMYRTQAKSSTDIIMPTQTTTTVTAVSQNVGSPTAAPSATPTMVSMQVSAVTPVLPTPYPTWTPIPPTPTKPVTPTVVTIVKPTTAATAAPITAPTAAPTTAPTVAPTAVPTVAPTTPTQKGG